MDLALLFTLSLCWWTAAGRSLWNEQPTILIATDEIEDGGTVEVACTLPIDYTGGDCRLWRKRSRKPIKVLTTKAFICTFYVTSKELLGRHQVGSRVYLKCDYHLQQYTSPFSDIKGVTVWGSSPSPSVSASRRFVSPDDSVEVTCSPPLRSISSCKFYRDQFRIAEGSCSQNLTGKQLAIWEKPTLLLTINLTCKYYPDARRNIRSEPSNHNMLFVVDTSQAVSSVDCKVSVDDDQPTAFRDNSWASVSANGLMVRVDATNSQLMINETCSYILSHT